MNVVLAAFPSYTYVEKAAKTTFVQKTLAYNVDEIDPLYVFGRNCHLKKCMLDINLPQRVAIKVL